MARKKSCTTAIFRWVVRARHASRKVRERVLRAPKTPATARVDLPDRYAKARLEAREAMWPLSLRAAVPRASAKVAACAQYVSVHPWPVNRAHHVSHIFCLSLHSLSEIRTLLFCLFWVFGCFGVFGCLVVLCLSLVLGSYLISVFIQFNQGDLRLSAHSASTRAKTKNVACKQGVQTL